MGEALFTFKSVPEKIGIKNGESKIPKFVSNTDRMEALLGENEDNEPFYMRVGFLSAFDEEVNKDNYSRLPHPSNSQLPVKFTEKAVRQLTNRFKVNERFYPGYLGHPTLFDSGYHEPAFYWVGAEYDDAAAQGVGFAYVPNKELARQLRLGIAAGAPQGFSIKVQYKPVSAGQGKYRYYEARDPIPHSIDAITDGYQADKTAKAQQAFQFSDGSDMTDINTFSETLTKITQLLEVQQKDIRELKEAPEIQKDDNLEFIRAQFMEKMDSPLKGFVSDFPEVLSGQSGNEIQARFDALSKRWTVAVAEASAFKRKNPNPEIRMPDDNYKSKFMEDE